MAIRVEGDMSATVTDYGQFYDLESYLLKVVKERFRELGSLSTFDFFCIVIWKANRAKSTIARGLLKRGYENLDAAVEALTSGLAKQGSAEEKLRYLFETWSFRLPMASAILTVLYPEEFTVYDERVCDMLDDFRDLKNKTSFNRLWPMYQSFLRAVEKAAPVGLTLREKDRYLWGKSFSERLHKDIAEWA
jgi:hypothetical protein